MTEETGIAMRPEEAIREICGLQRKQNNEIKKLQEDFESIQERITTRFDEINTKVGRELDNINDKLSSHITSTTTQMNLQLTSIRENVSELIEGQMHKIHAETKTIKEQNTSNWTDILKEIQEIKHTLTDSRAVSTNDERTHHSENNQNTAGFITIPKDAQPERNVSSPTMSNDASSVHSQNVETNQNRIQTILLPAATSAPIFHGKASERPGQFLIRVEEYTETVHMWGEDMLLRGISQFLKDNALEWYCQLRSGHYLPRTWNEFKQTFIKQFNSPIRIAQHKQQWKECRQNKDETINEFIIRLRALWVEQYPHESETELIKHLFCKMRPEILNVMGYARNSTLQETLVEAQRVEEILYYRAKQEAQANQTQMNYSYNINNYSRNINEPTQAYRNGRSEPTYPQRQNNQSERQRIKCLKCGRFNHQTRDCWYNNGYNNTHSQQPNSYSKNE